MQELQPDPNACNECGLAKSKQLHFLWWRWAVPHWCRPYSDKAMAARQRWVLKCILHYHHPGDHAYEWAKIQSGWSGWSGPAGCAKKLSVKCCSSPIDD